MALVRASSIKAENLILNTDTGEVAPFSSFADREDALADIAQRGLQQAGYSWSVSPLIVHEGNPIQHASDRLQGVLSNFEIRDAEDLTALQVICVQCEAEQEYEASYLADVETDDTMAGLAFMVIHHWIDRHEGK